MGGGGWQETDVSWPLLYPGHQDENSTYILSHLLISVCLVFLIEWLWLNLGFYYVSIFPMDSIIGSVRF